MTEHLPVYINVYIMCIMYNIIIMNLKKRVGIDHY